MRIKFLRIFPEMCASTWCLFSSSTRNIALGSGSSTVAMTSMASSLGNQSLSFAGHFFFLSQAIDDFHQLDGNVGCGRSAVDLVEATRLFVILDERVGLFPVM